MKTTADLKQEFIDHIATLDKANMSLAELSAYADLVRKADDLFKPSYAEMMANGLSPLFQAAQQKGGGDNG